MATSSPNNFTHEIFTASAGSGKTFQLVHKYIALLAAGAQPDSILATTFSRKAAYEIFERILLYLVEAVENETSACDMAKIIQQEHFSSEEARVLLCSLIQHQSKLLIGTLDSFAQTIGALFYDRIGLLRTWQIPDEQQTLSIEEDAIHNVLSMNHQSLQTEQLADLLTHDGTRTVFARLHRSLSALRALYIETSTDAWEWKLSELTSFHKGDFEELLKSFQELEIPKTKKGTTHTVWKKAHEASLQALESQDFITYLSKGVSLSIAKEDSSFSRVSIPDNWRISYRNANQYVITHLLEKLISKTAQLRSFLSSYTEHYQSLERSRGLHGFDSVKYHLSFGLHDISNIDLAYRLDRKITHILLDEFQDTSFSEWALLQPLVDEITASSNENRSITIVGDPKQAIYGWRGGSAELFSFISEKYQSFYSRELTYSYRSSPIIIDFINAVFSNLSSANCLEAYSSPVQSWSKAFTSHQAAKSDLPGYVHLQEGPEDGELAERIAIQIEELLNQQPNISIGLLVRSNKELLPFVLALEDRGILVSAEGGHPLTDSPLVVACLHLLHAIIHPGDSRSWHHVFATPLRNCIPEVSEYEPNQSMERIAASFRRIITREGLAPFLRKLVSSFSVHSSERDEVRAEQLLELAISFDLNPQQNLQSFISQVRQKRVEDHRPGTVRAMTIHRSKGLEFDAVFLPNLNYSFTQIHNYHVFTEKKSDSIIPTKVISYANKEIRAHVPKLDALYQTQVSDKLQEELSVFYVAATRARQAIYITLSNTSQKSRSPKVSGEAILRELIFKERGTISYGNENWLASSSFEEDKDSEQPTPERESLEPQQQRKVRNKFLPIKSATKKDHHLSPQRNRRGHYLHSLVQQIEWIEDALPERDINLEKVLRIQDEEGAQYHQELLEALTSDPIRRCFSRLRNGDGAKGSFKDKTVYREYPFAFMNNGHIVRGVIDRIVTYKVDDILQAEIYDVKSGYLEDSIESLERTFSSQLSLYRDALHLIIPQIVNVKCFLCCIDRRETHYLR